MSGRAIRPEEVFSGRAENYAAARSGYPRELFAWLMESARLAPGAVAADVGAGTGKFTESLLDCGLAVHAVDPNAQMLEQAMARLLAHTRTSTRTWAAARRRACPTPPWTL